MGFKKYSLTSLPPKSRIPPTENFTKSSINGHTFEKSSETKQCVECKTFLGLFYIVVTSFLFAAISVIVKKLVYINSSQLTLVRNIGVFCGCLPVAVFGDKEVLGAREQRIALFTVSAIGSTAMLLNVVANKHLPLAEAAVLLATTPAVSAVVAHVCLNEPCGRTQKLLVIVTFCGVILSVRLPELILKRDTHHFDALYLGGLAGAVFCVLFRCLQYVMVKKTEDTHYSVVLVYMSIFGIMQNVAMTIPTNSLVNPTCGGGDSFLITLMAVFSFAGQCTFVLALQTEAVGIVAVVKNSLDVIVAMMFQVMFFNENIDTYLITGALLVILPVTVTGLSKWLKTLPEESKTRKRLKFLLV